VSSPLTWVEARGAAEALTFGGQRGHLVTIASVEEQQFIVRSVLPALAQYSDWWLGGYQDKTASDYREPAGGWRWVTGEPWSFTNWQAGQPDNSKGAEDRLHLVNNGRWNDVASSFALGGYVIEFDTPAEYGAPAVAMLEIIPAPVSGGHLATGQVTLTAPAGPGGMAVTLSSSNPDVASPVIDRIVIFAGSVSATFKIRTCRSTAAAYLTISATANGITKSRELTVYP
jgi:Lectin C-type domain